MNTKNQMLAIAGGILIASAVKAVVTITAGAASAWYAKRKIEKALREE